MLLFDHVMHTDFFNYRAGGQVLLYQHVFWFYSHPAVYIMMLPGFGIVSEVVSVMARKPIFGYRAVAFSTISIGVLGFTVWAHHMFVSGMPTWRRIPIMISSLLIAVPTGIKIFSWVSTLWNGVLNMATPMLFALGFIFLFRAWWALRGLAGPRAGRRARVGHVLHRRPHPLRAVRRLGLHDLCRAASHGAASTVPAHRIDLRATGERCRVVDQAWSEVGG
jgi:hypothetical protein